MSTRAGVFCLLAVVSGLDAASPAIRAQEQSPRVREYLAHQLSAPAVWRQDNPAFATGTGEPMRWERVLRLGPDPDVVTADAFAVMEDGACRQVIHQVFWWDGAHGGIAVDAFAAGGARFSGRVIKVDDAWVVEADGRLPDGSTIRIRDVPGTSQPDAYSSVGYRWTGNAWERGDETTWRRAARSGC